MTEENEKPVFFFDIDNCVSVLCTPCDVLPPTYWHLHVVWYIVVTELRDSHDLIDLLPNLEEL
jgi:hypothetical protein